MMGRLSAICILSLFPALGTAAEQPRMSEMQKAIQEFRVQTRNLGLRPESSGAGRRNGPKPKWHGRIYENLRNDLLDAVPHEIRQRGSHKSLLRRNQFGFNVAGPLAVPKLFSLARTTFFSVSYEGVRERISRSFLRTVPTGGERMGDFGHVVDQSGQPLPIFDPLSTRPNPDFESSRPVASGNLQYLRDPFPANHIPRARLDPVVLGRIGDIPEPNSDAGPFFRNNYFAVSPETNTANGMIVKVDHSLSDRQRLEFETAFSNGFAGTARLFPGPADPNPPDRRFHSRRGSLEHIWTISPRTVHTASLGVYTNSSRNEAEVVRMDRFGGSYSPLGRINPEGRSAHSTFVFREGISARRGKQTFRFSAQHAAYRVNAYSSYYPAGIFQFGAGLTSLPGIINTGHSFASYLLGLSEYAEVSRVMSPSYFRNSMTSLTARHQYEITPYLTISTGLGLEVHKPRVEKHDRQSTVDLKAVNPANSRPGALIAAGRGGRGRSFQPVRVRLEPSLSLAWNPARDSKTVLRMAYSRGYYAIPVYATQFGTQGFNTYPTFISPNVQLQPAVKLRNGLLAFAGTMPDLRPEAANDTVADLIDPSDRQPRIQSASLSLERQLPGAFVLTIGAGHVDGRNMLAGNAAVQPNAIPLDALAYRDQLNDEAFRRSLRPYPQYQGFDTGSVYPLGHYQRDAGYVRLEKRTSSGLGLTSTYEFSKQLDDYSTALQDLYDRENEWSLSAGNEPHRLSLTYVYELPFGAGKGLLGYSDWRRQLVEGWSISGITSLRSGEPLVLRPQFNNTGGVVRALRVNVVPDVDPRAANPGAESWFNPNAFAQPEDFTIGNASRTHPFLLTPPAQRHDLSLTKRFPLAAERTLEFNAVAFNFLNHANLNEPDTVIGPVSAPNINAGRIIGTTGGRVVQLGVRYSF